MLSGNDRKKRDNRDNGGAYLVTINKEPVNLTMECNQRHEAMAHINRETLRSFQRNQQ